MNISPFGSLPGAGIPGSEDIAKTQGAFGLAGSHGPKRIINWFDVPEPIAGLTGVSKIGMVEVTTSEELTAGRRVGMAMMGLGIEMAKESLRYVNDTPVHTGDLSAEAFWNSTQPGMPMLRKLISEAYAEIHNPPPGTAAVFLKSRRQIAG